MAAQQENSLELNPNGLNFSRVAVYERVIRANLARVWENVLDWEHLPHLHETTFDYCELDEAGEWGWRTFSNPEQSDHIELCVDRDQQQYVARSYRAQQQFSEIWTRLFDRGQETAIEVSFYAHDVPDENQDKVGQIYLSLYEQLWDEDEAMMRERQQRLDAKSTDRSVDLGPEDSLVLPARVAVQGKEFLLTRESDELRLRYAVCPHLLGPLAQTEDGHLHCPWHGYRFDPTTRECMSPTGATCELPKLPDIRQTPVDDTTHVIIEYSR